MLDVIGVDLVMKQVVYDKLDDEFKCECFEKWRKVDGCIEYQIL